MESLVHYSSPAHSVSLLSVLNEQRLKGQFCDVVLMVGENRFPAHRCILAASSEYFQTLFSRRDSENRNIIHLDFCEPEAFEIVINYVYTSSLFVDKGSLAVIQELGYSLGIPFLTNIMSARPQASYCVSRKRLSFCEEDDGTFQKRSVIVHQGGMTGSAILPGKASRHTSGETVPRSGQAFPTSGRSETGMNLSRSTTKDPENKTFLPSILKNHPEYRPPLIRPQLTSSVSFSESVQHLNSDAIDDPAEEMKPEPAYHPKLVSGGQQGIHQQTVDRSGPLIKSLLRRSLSMDSPVPVFSPVLELKDSQSRDHSVVKSMKTEGSLSSVSKHLPPLVLRAKSLKEDKEAQGSELTIKREASSPLADPSEIIRITVEDNLPVSFKDFQSNYDENPRYFSPSVKRKMILDASNHAFKRSRVLGEHRKDSVDSISSELPRNSGMDKCEQEPGELRPSKTFKCWSCMKVFRSNAGLYRHINMYHNPEKPYSCDICHKRFHTNFKVWTHCQTQHGVVQNPAASSSSYSVLDEKLQRKLIDIVREREIKKALIMKLRRNKQAHQGQPFSRKSRRSRSYGCPYCGKMFYFQSHFKMHMKGHIAERTNIEVQQQDTGCERQDLTDQGKDHQDKEVFPCRLCNEKLSSPSELEEHERACRYATVCPYCGLRFSNTMVKKDHETHCKYKKLTCLECMRTFKSSFSIWRHQVEVHNQNMMTVREQLTFGYSDANRETSDHLQVPPSSQEPLPVEQVDRREDISYGDSEDSSNAPEDLSSHNQGKLVVKEEPQEELVTDQEPLASEEPGVWPCEKCGKLFSSHKTLERHQELLCHIKPFICHICHKAFRTNFRLWSHYQSHSEDPVTRPAEERPCSPSPSPPLTIAVQDPSTSQASSPNPAQTENTLSSDEPRALMSSVSVPKHPEQEETENGVRNLVHSRSDNAGKPATSQESDTLFYHAPTLSALTFKRQYMCKLCHRTFKTAFSLWSHEQSHGHI